MSEELRAYYENLSTNEKRLVVEITKTINGQICKMLSNNWKPTIRFDSTRNVGISNRTFSEKVLTFQIFGVNSVNDVTLPNIKNLLCSTFPELNRKSGSGINVELQTEFKALTISIDTELLVIDSVNYNSQHQGINNFTTRTNQHQYPYNNNNNNNNNTNYNYDYNHSNKNYPSQPLHYHQREPERKSTKFCFIFAFLILFMIMILYFFPYYFYKYLVEDKNITQ
jgi:hypothetical protein